MTRSPRLVGALLLLHLFFLPCSAAHAEYSWQISAGAVLARGPASSLPAGPGLQFLIKYGLEADAAACLKAGYARHTGSERFGVDWYDALATNTATADVTAHRVWTSVNFGPYFEKTIEFRGQAESAGIAKNLRPYVGAGIDFDFIVMASSYSIPPVASLPGYLASSLSDGLRLLPPTFGGTLRLGLKILLSGKDRLDLFGQYSALIPSEAESGHSVNHFFFAGIGYERKLGGPEKR